MSNIVYLLYFLGGACLVVVSGYMGVRGKLNKGASGYTLYLPTFYRLFNMCSDCLIIFATMLALPDNFFASSLVLLVIFWLMTFNLALWRIGRYIAFKANQKDGIPTPTIRRFFVDWPVRPEIDGSTL